MPMFLVHLADLQAPITQADLVDDGLVLRFVMTERRGLAGGPAIVELEIKNPGLVLLSRTGAVAVVDTPTGLLADGRILARARMARYTEDLGQGTVTLRLECAHSSWKGLVKTAANNSVQGAGIAPYTIPTFPEPGVGTIALAFANSPAVKWDVVRSNAIRVSAAFQEDLGRTPLSSLLKFTTLAVTNGLAILTIPDGQAARDAAKRGLAVLIGLSGDKDPRNAVPFAAGIAVAIRSAPAGQVDVIVNMASTLLSTAGITPAASGDRTRLGLPFYDPLIPGQRDDLSTAVLEGRSAVWHIDPVSHEISLDDVIVGQRVVDLADLGDAASERRAAIHSPVAHVKARLVVEFSQTAFGRTDVAPIVNGVGASGALLSLLNSPGGFPQSETGGENNVGWSTSTPVVTVTKALTNPMYTGRSFVVTYRDDTHYWVPKDPVPGETVPKVTSNWVNGTEYDVVHQEKACFIVNGHVYQSWFWSYNLNQVRREVVDIVLDIDAQTFALGEDTLDLGTLQLNDPNSIDGIQPYADGVAYNRGDRVLFRGRVYECLADRVISLFALSTTVRNGIPTTTMTTPYWQDLGVSTPMGDPRTPSFIDTTRGRQAVEAVLLRCRAAGLNRLSALRWTKTFPWSAARDVSMRDTVRFLVRDGDAVLPVKGKVEEIVRRVEGGGTASVDITITVAVGTGRNDPLSTAPTPYALGYAADGYTRTVQPQFVAPLPGFVASGTVGAGGTPDVEYALSGDPLIAPIDFFRLSDPAYACLSVVFRNDADEQLGRVAGLIAQNRNPSTVTQDYPSNLTVTMRPLRTEGSIIRNLLCHAALTVSPRGVDLVNGGEP